MGWVQHSFSLGSGRRALSAVAGRAWGTGSVRMYVRHVCGGDESSVLLPLLGIPGATRAEGRIWGKEE